MGAGVQNKSTFAALVLAQLAFDQAVFACFTLEVTFPPSKPELQSE